MDTKKDFLEIVRDLKYTRNSSLRKNVIGDKGKSIALSYGVTPFRGGCFAEDMKKNGKVLFDKIENWFRKYSPEKDFSFNSIYMNKNVEVLKHKDCRNAGDSYFFYVIDGEDVSGGELMIYDEKDENKIDKVVTENNFVRMNGFKQYHEGKSFTGGDRYSVVFYTNNYLETTEAIKDYVICIPSYNRAEMVKEKTLKLLEKHNINPLKIFIYVSSVEEKKEYKKILRKAKYNDIKIGKLGLIQNRQFILDDYPNDFNILFLDDDLEEFDLSLSENKYESLDEFINYGFKKAREENCYLWGIYPVWNSFFREKQKEYTTDLRYIVGCFYGVINRYKCKELETDLKNSQKEDVERTLKWFVKDGKVLRFNKIGMKTKYCKNKGGLGLLKDRFELAKSSALYLNETYPKYGKIKIRKNGFYEFVLKTSIHSGLQNQ